MRRDAHRAPIRRAEPTQATAVSEQPTGKPICERTDPAPLRPAKKPVLDHVHEHRGAASPLTCRSSVCGLTRRSGGASTRLQQQSIPDDDRAGGRPVDRLQHQRVADIAALGRENRSPAAGPSARPQGRAAGPGPTASRTWVRTTSRSTPAGRPAQPNNSPTRSHNRRLQADIGQVGWARPCHTLNPYSPANPKGRRDVTGT